MNNYSLYQWPETANKHSQVRFIARDTSARKDQCVARSNLKGWILSLGNSPEDRKLFSLRASDKDYRILGLYCVLLSLNSEKFLCASHASTTKGNRPLEDLSYLNNPPDPLKVRRKATHQHPLWRAHQEIDERIYRKSFHRRESRHVGVKDSQAEKINFFSGKLSEGCYCRGSRLWLPSAQSEVAEINHSLFPSPDIQAQCVWD